MAIVAGLMLAAAVAAAPGAAPAAPSAGAPRGELFTGQKALDFIAGFPIPDAPKQPGDPYLPRGPFAGWTAEERRTLPAKISQSCLVLWIMSHGAPGARMLPATISDTDETVFGTGLCIAGHMPADWPDRRVWLQQVAAVLARAQAAGSPLRLPPALAAEAPGAAPLSP